MATTSAKRIDPGSLNLKEQVVAINRVTKVVKGGKNLSFSATYLYYHGLHLTRTRDINLFAPVPTVINTNPAITPAQSFTFLRFPGTTSPSRPISRPTSSARRGRPMENRSSRSRTWACTAKSSSSIWQAA